MRRAHLLLAALATACCGNVSARALPDWSGEWEMVGLTPSDGGLYLESDEEIAARWNHAPYNNDPVQAAFRDRVGLGRSNAAASSAPRTASFACSFGFPNLGLESPATFEALVTPHQTSLVFSTREVRNIYTDGRKHTPDDEIWPTYWGDSIGHWEGATLVVDTIAVTSPFLPPALKKLGAGTVVGLGGGTGGGPPTIAAVFSDKARFIERIRLLSSGELEDVFTVRDPVALSAPWILTRRYRKIDGVNRMIFQDCEGDTRHSITNGEVTLKVSQ